MRKRSKSPSGTSEGTPVTAVPSPAGPTDAPERLGPDDAGEILTLQRAAYITEAQAHDDAHLPPLTQSLADLRAELTRPSVTAWGFRDTGRLLAAVRVDVDRSVARLGRLVVAPDCQGRGLGSRLLRAAERRCPTGVSTVELFTGERSVANLRLYHRLGYRETHRSNAGTYQLVHLTKLLSATDSPGPEAT